MTNLRLEIFYVVLWHNDESQTVNVVYSIYKCCTYNIKHYKCVIMLKESGLLCFCAWGPEDLGTVYILLLLSLLYLCIRIFTYMRCCIFILCTPIVDVYVPHNGHLTQFLQKYRTALQISYDNLVTETNSLLYSSIIKCS